MLLLASNTVYCIPVPSVKQLTPRTTVTAQATADDQFIPGTARLIKYGVLKPSEAMVSKSPVLTSRGDLPQLQPAPASPPKEEVRYFNVPLSRELQHYIWEQSKEYGIPYETVLAVIQTESTFNPKADNGIAGGLMQINYSDGTLDKLAKECGISNPNVHNPYQNVQMGIYYLNYLYQYWVNHGVTEHTLSAALISYNRGLCGGIAYVRNNGFTDSYTTKVFRHQDELQ